MQTLLHCCFTVCAITTAASGKNEAAATQAARRARLEAREAAAAVTTVTAECETAAADVAAVAGPRTLVTRLKQVNFNLLELLDYTFGLVLLPLLLLCKLLVLTLLLQLLLLLLLMSSCCST
jgi:hypothetical protein